MSHTPIDHGGPAFPLNASDAWGGPTQGMTLRDWFAGQADVADALPLLNLHDCEAMIGRSRPSDFVGLLKWHFDVIAHLRMMSADAMIEARK